MKIERAHLYVEKYSKLHQEILLDFVREDEFLCFKYYGDYTAGMHLSGIQYEPTMLLLHGCVPVRKIYEGSMLTVNMDKLLALRAEMGYFEHIEGENQDNPATVYLEASNGTAFAELIDDPESSVSNYIRNEFIYDLEPSWKGAPCALDNMEDSFELRVWNVGQGSTNSVSDQHYLTLFDFGASIYYSRSQLESIFQGHRSLFEGKRRISMIISHWDCDHYNFLCVASDAFLKNICCIFYPPSIVTLTAQQIAARIKACCGYRVLIPPAQRAPFSRCGIHAVYHNSNYTLFTGEKARNPNRSGLLLALYSKNATALLTADHSNYQVWDNMYTNIKRKDNILHIVVPHHGGDCGTPAARSVASPGTAVVSVGSNNYNHPRPATLAQYRCAQYKLIRTDHCQSDVIVRMV